MKMSEEIKSARIKPVKQLQPMKDFSQTLAQMNVVRMNEGVKMLMR